MPGGWRLLDGMCDLLQWSDTRQDIELLPFSREEAQRKAGVKTGADRWPGC